MKAKFLIAVVLIALVVGIYYSHKSDDGKSSTGANLVNQKLLALLVDADRSLVIGKRSQTDGCRTRGPLPDPDCTPGAVFANATPDEICVPGYTKTVRSVSVGLKAQIYAEYGLSYPQERGAYEADHLIPLELGGNNNIANLFPEAAEPAPGFREKDLVENYLHNEVCAGHANLAAAQKQIAHDWVAVYKILTPGEFAALRAQISNWSN